MGDPGADRIEHYVRMFQQLETRSWAVAESLCWTVLRPHGAPLSLDEVVRRLGGDPAGMTAHRPVDLGWDAEVVYVEQRGDAFVLVAYDSRLFWEEALERLSRGASVHGVFFLINNFNRLYHAVDGVVVTELDIRWPEERWGADPDALNNSLATLHALSASELPGPDWETAMAVVESLTGEQLDAGWFRRPQLVARDPEDGFKQ